MNFLNVNKSRIWKSVIKNKLFYSTSYNTLITSKKGQNQNIGFIQFNRPKALNALCSELLVELKDAMNNFNNDPSIKCIILTGSEKAFAAGADIKEMSTREYSNVYGTDFLNEFDTVGANAKPLIAAVNGYAFGGGCEMAMACDIIYAGENAKFSQPEIKLGTIPGGGGTQRLVRVIGKSRAMELVLTGDVIDAKEALARGLVSKVFPSNMLVDETIKLGEKISKMSALSVKAAKQAVTAAYNTTLETGLRFEKNIFYGTFATNDRREGMKAFLEKRDAKFTDS